MRRDIVALMMNNDSGNCKMLLMLSVACKTFHKKTCKRLQFKKYKTINSITRHDVIFHVLIFSILFLLLYFFSFGSWLSIIVDVSLKLLFNIVRALPTFTVLVHVHANHQLKLIFTSKTPTLTNLDLTTSLSSLH